MGTDIKNAGLLRANSYGDSSGWRADKKSRSEARKATEKPSSQSRKGKK